MPTSPPLIEIDDVTVERDLTTILRNLSWQVHPGENWIIFGPNGAGKTTLLNVIQGYLWPTSGKVRVLGGELGNGVDVRELRRYISIVSEPVRNLINEGLSGLEVLVTGARAHLNIFDPPTSDELAQAHALAAQTKIEPLLAKPFAVMSTGERQRILITRALMPEPKIVILDEPAAGLDLAGREWVLRTIEAVSHQPNPPVFILTTHHVEEITSSFTHALLLKEGELYRAGKISETFTSETVGSLFDITVQLERVHGRFAVSALR